ncbi:MAG: alpha/beta hydrolase [Croceivirga sp.]
MKHLYLVALLLCTFTMISQEIIELPKEHTGELFWETPEKQYFSEVWKTEVVTNVSKPTMRVFLPESNVATKAAVVIAPGGGLYALSIENEGNAVAQWLNEKGVAAFVLKYHLVPTGEDGVQEITDLSISEPTKIMTEVSKVLPYSIQDGLNAITHIRENAKKYGVDPEKIGFMGFSAGGAVTMGIGYNYTKENRPNFLVPVYAWTDAQDVMTPKKDAPPMCIVCASDDPLGLAKGSIDLYSSMFKANKSVSLMMYAKGGHGFGMNAQGLPSDTWIERFYDWGLSENLIPKSQK